MLNQKINNYSKITYHRSKSTKFKSKLTPPLKKIKVKRKRKHI